MTMTDKQFPPRGVAMPDRRTTRRIQVNAYIPEDIARMMRANADAEHGGNMTATVSAACREYLRKRYGDE